MTNENPNEWRDRVRPDGLLRGWTLRIALRAFFIARRSYIAASDHARVSVEAVRKSVGRALRRGLDDLAVIEGMTEAELEEAAYRRKPRGRSAPRPRNAPRAPSSEFPTGLKWRSDPGDIEMHPHIFIAPGVQLVIEADDTPEKLEQLEAFAKSVAMLWDQMKADADK